MQDQKVNILLLGCWWDLGLNIISLLVQLIWSLPACGQHTVNFYLCGFHYLQIILKDMAQKRFVIWKEYVWSPGKHFFFLFWKIGSHFYGAQMSYPGVLRTSVHLSVFFSMFFSACFCSLMSCFLKFFSSSGCCSSFSSPVWLLLTRTSSQTCEPGSLGRQTCTWVFVCTIWHSSEDGRNHHSLFSCRRVVGSHKIPQDSSEWPGLAR